MVAVRQARKKCPTRPGLFSILLLILFPLTRLNNVVVDPFCALLPSRRIGTSENLFYFYFILTMKCFLSVHLVFGIFFALHCAIMGGEPQYWKIKPCIISIHYQHTKACSLPFLCSLCPSQTASFSCLGNLRSPIHWNGVFHHVRLLLAQLFKWYDISSVTG